MPTYAAWLFRKKGVKSFLTLWTHRCYGFQFPGFLHLSITSALSRVLAQCILPSSMLHLRCDCLSPVLYQRSLPSLYLLHSPCRLCEVLPLYVCMSERFSFYSVYLLSLTHAELTLSICLQPALRPPARSEFWFSATCLDLSPSLDTECSLPAHDPLPDSTHASAYHHHPELPVTWLFC